MISLLSPLEGVESKIFVTRIFSQKTLSLSYLVHRVQYVVFRRRVHEMELKEVFHSEGFEEKDDV